MYGGGKSILLVLSTFILVNLTTARQVQNELAKACKPKSSAGLIVYGDCAIDVNKDLASVAPIITPAGKLDWYETNNQGILEIKNGEWIDMYCEGSFAAPFSNETKLKAQCLQDKYFLVNGKIHEFINFNCTGWPNYVARRTGRACNKGTDLLKVGYEIKDAGFLHVMDICHDEQQETTRYSHFKMTPGNAKHQSGVLRPWFAQQDFYGDQNVNTLYTKVKQKETFAKILQKNVSEFFIGDDVYLARGHLAAKADFIYAPEQRASFLFVNVAPQWQTFNADNWAKVERSVRLFVGNQSLYVDCYTGIYGVSTLPDVNNVQKELYLDFDSNGHGLIPVPKLFYRVVYESKTNYGIVLLGVNNPHATLKEIESSYIICPDISDQLNWLDWDRHNLTAGYSYACSVPSFVKVVDYLPAEVQNVSGTLGVSKAT